MDQCTFGAVRPLARADAAPGRRAARPGSSERKIQVPDCKRPVTGFRRAPARLAAQGRYSPTRLREALSARLPAPSPLGRLRPRPSEAGLPGAVSPSGRFFSR